MAWLQKIKSLNHLQIEPRLSKHSQYIAKQENKKSANKSLALFLYINEVYLK